MDKLDAIEWADKKLEDPDAQTDGGCTMSPDFNFKLCCLRHDVMINYNQGISDKQAHRILRECMTDRDHPYLAWLYWFYVSFSSAVGGPLNAAAITVISVGIGVITWLT